MPSNHHTTTRIPVNDEYAALVGKAVYVFAYYEWTIIYIINYLENGFVSEYSRPTKKTAYTSGNVSTELKRVIGIYDYSTSTITRTELDALYNHFYDLVIKRNALIHAHPITAKDGSQILSYQTNVSKRITDMLWPKENIEQLIQEIDEVAVNAARILDKLRPDSNK